MAENVEKIPLGVSSCLLGEKVRFDGGHKRNDFVVSQLNQFFEFKSFCPEMSIGLGVPREPIRLVLDVDENVKGSVEEITKDELHQKLRVVGTKNPALDVTKDLTQCAQEQQSWIESVYGYILKKDSPSCGMERVKYYKNDHPQRSDGRGVFAATMMRNNPLLPVEEEGRLNDARIRENFVLRVYTWHRWKALVESGITAKKIVEFHSRQKFLLMSRSQKLYRELGRLVSNIPKETLQDFADEYIAALMSGLKVIATRKNHVNVLHHIQGYLKDDIDGDDKQEIVKVIGDYRNRLVPLVVPVTLLRHYFRKNPDDYIGNSWYLSPYPDELGLQNNL